MITKISLEQVRDAVLNVVREDIGIEEVEISSTLKNLDIDSLTFAEILVNIEDTLDVELELDDSLSKDEDLTIEKFIIAIHEGLTK